MNKMELWKMIQWPLQVGMVVGLGVAAFSLTLPNQYKSEARILPADQRGIGSMAGMAAAAAAVGVSIPGQESADAAYVDILNSRWLRESLLKETFNFKIRTWRFGSEQARQESLQAYLKAKNLDRGFKKLKSRMTVTRDLKTKLITIGVETESPELSQLVVRKAVKHLDEFVVERSKTKGGNKARFAEQRLQESRKSMDEAEVEFRNFLNVNRNYQQSPDPGIRLRGARLEAELKLRQQLVSTLTLGREQALLEEKNDMPILNVLDAGNLPIEKSKPARSTLVLLASFLAALATWAWQNREWIRKNLMQGEENSGGISPS